MRKLYYYYDAIVKFDDDIYYVDYYHTDGKNTSWSGGIYGKSYDEVLNKARRIINTLNQPKPFFGNGGRLSEWIRWKKKIRNQKKFKI